MDSNTAMANLAILVEIITRETGRKVNKAAMASSLTLSVPLREKEYGNRANILALKPK